MKILLVQSYLGRKEPPVMPVGLAYLASMVSEHDVKLIDLNICSNPYDELSALLSSFRPEVVGISIRNIDSQQRKDLYYYYKELPRLLGAIRRAAAEVRIVAGGAGFSMFAREIMVRHKEIDFGIFHEGEETFPALINSLSEPEKVPNLYYRKGASVRYSKAGTPPDFTSLPIPRKDILRMDVYKKDKWAIGINTKRGCPFKCSYCNYPLLNGLKVRMRRPEHVVDEIEELVREYGVESFMFADGVFSSPFSHAKAICDEIKKRKLKVKWCAWCDVKDITDEFMETVSSAGCNFVVISPDAYSNQALEVLNKGFTTDDINRAFEVARRWPQVRMGFGLFLTTPGETLGGYLKTVFFYFRTVASLLLSRKGGGGLSWIRIEPDTRIYEIAMKEGIISRSTDLLPENIEELRKLFYVNPRLRFLDPFSRMLVSVLNLRRLLAPRRG